MGKTVFDAGKPVTITIGPDIMFLWPYLFEKKKDDMTGRELYQVDTLIPLTNQTMIDRVDDAIDEVIKRGLSGDNPKYSFRPGTEASEIWTPLKSIDDIKKTSKYRHLYEGHLYLKPKTEIRPKIFDSNRQEILDKENFRMGCRGAVNLTFYMFNRNGNQGVSVLLNHVMVLAESELEIGAYVDPETAFDEFAPRGGQSGAMESPRRSRQRPGSDMPTLD